MDPACWTYLGFQLDGEIYVYACLPFGISQAPQVFTRAMGFVYAALRARDLHCTQVIDDVHSACATQMHAWWQLWLHVRILTALGFVFGTAKCPFRPVQVCKFLGLLLDSQRGRFAVPDDKLHRFAERLERLREC